MFPKSKNKNPKSENTNNHDNENKNAQESSLKSWLSGRIGSALIFSGVGFALYKFQILPKIFSFFKKDKGKQRASENPSTSKSTDTEL